MLKAEAVSFERKDESKTWLNFQDINIEIKRGEIVSLLGASGIGKSTIARILSGLQKYDTGKVTCDGKIFSQPYAPIALVFQDYKNAVFPWLTVEENIKMGFSKPNTAGHGYMSIKDVCDYLDIFKILNKYPAELSGGQVQRVQLARALVSGVDFLILDEPDTSLDMEFKKQFLDKIVFLVKQQNMGVFLITHSIDRALHVSHRGYILKRKKSNEIEISQFDGFEQKIPFSEVMGSDKFKEVYQCIYGNSFQ